MDRLDLRLKASRLIAEDREALGCDASHLREFEDHIDHLVKAVARIMREGLDRLTKMGI